MSSFASVIEKLRAGAKNIKLLFLTTIVNQRHIATGSRTYTSFSFGIRKFPSKLVLAFLKSASTVGSWRASQHKIELFGLSNLVFKVTMTLLYNMSFERSQKNPVRIDNAIPRFKIHNHSRME